MSGRVQHVLHLNLYPASMVQQAYVPFQFGPSCGTAGACSDGGLHSIAGRLQMTGIGLSLHRVS